MNKIFAITALALAALLFNACSSEDGEESVAINKSSYKEQKAASDNGYCPLLPYPFDPRIPCRGGQVVKENPDGSIECQGIPVTADMLEEAEEESRLYWERQAEGERMYRDSARTATVAFSNSQTFIQLSPVFVYADLSVARLKDSKANDTLYIEAVPGKNGDYAQAGGMPGTGCPISLDITLNHADENIAVIVFEKYQLFQVKQ